MSGLSSRLPRATGEKGTLKPWSTGNLQLPRDPIINTCAKNHISTPRVFPKSPHRQHEEQSTTNDAAVRAGNRRMLPPIHQTRDRYTHLTHSSYRAMRRAGHKSSGVTTFGVTRGPKAQLHPIYSLTQTAIKEAKSQEDDERSERRRRGAPHRRPHTTKEERQEPHTPWASSK